MQFKLGDLATKLGASSTDQLPAILLLNGNEPLFIEEALDRVREQLKTQGFTERIKYQVETGFDWSQLTGAGLEMSLFSERRILELRVPKSLGAPGTKAITEYCENPSPDDILLVMMPLLDKRQRQAKWAKKVNECGWIVDSPDITQQQFPAWLKQRLQSRSLRVESGVVEILCQQLEGNILAAAQEIDKLKVLASDGAVTIALVNDSLADQARFDVYALTDVCLLGNVERARRIKQRLQSEGIEPVIIVWALVRELRTLLAIAFALQSNASPQAKSQVFKQYRIWSKREPMVNAALQRHSASALAELLERAAFLDQTVKGQRALEAGSIWHQIEQLCAAICGIEVVRHVRLRA